MAAKSNPTLLMISGQAGHFDSLRRSLSAANCRCEPRRANDLPLALARLEGGGVDLVLMDLSDWRTSPTKLDNLMKFPAAAPGLPFVLWSDSDDASLPAIAAQAGAVGCVSSRSAAAEWQRMFTHLVDAAPAPAESGPSRSATVVSIMGVKGGIGATTAAVNVAAALASRGSVVLAEIRPVFGGLQSHFHPGRLVRGFSARHAGSVSETVKSLLWPAPSVPGLRVLFGPQSPADCGEFDAAHARRWIEALSAESDFLVLDLPYSLSGANAAMLASSHHALVVLDPSPACVRLAFLTLETIRSWDKFPASLAAVAIRRSPDGSPMPAAEIESSLGVPLMKVIPPAPVLCLKSERTHTPLIQCDPDSMVSESFVSLSRSFHPGGGGG
jgi:MinD-like ATPase involved in chromosome partitioning or flagellar assembly